MKPTNVSPCVITDKLNECRKFYTKHFGATITFDCDWLINLTLNTSDRDVTSIQFMSPRSPRQSLFQGNGLAFNIDVPSSDEFHKKLIIQAGLEIVMPLEDHPWGDRGFSVKDPAGIHIYIYHLIEPSDEYKQFFTEPEETTS
ncbi:Glyoxalase-like domain protein [Poriferisphaera corsica]|uniref:Glyoxalase-like domain protein n=1 Tax=Poriferisphaera corsica TaxID=2528020 RepID=A0A517YV94_9BACT|nr:VOC family protein [Poriferisphaera corsica]QDU34151.1 Glyoxalase-like domain protein [Poriferisphaera corsica]